MPRTNDEEHSVRGEHPTKYFYSPYKSHAEEKAKEYRKSGYKTKVSKMKKGPVSLQRRGDKSRAGHYAVYGYKTAINPRKRKGGK